MLFTSSNINLALWDRGIREYRPVSSGQGGSVSTKIKSTWVHRAQGETWGAGEHTACVSVMTFICPVVTSEL